MANTSVSSELQVKKYLSDFYSEFVRENMFSPYTGTSSSNVINIKMGRKQCEIPLVTRLKGGGVSGSSTLRGNGENIGNHGITLTPTYYRHAVEFDREELEKPAIDLMKAARPLLMDWGMELVRDQTIEAMGAVHNGTSYFNYGDATAAQRNSWAVNNSDRILYGSDDGNYSGVHATDLLKIVAADTAGASEISLMKRLAKNADPHIRPIRVKGGYEYFVAFCDSYTFRDIKTDLQTSHQNALPRSKDNILFQDGDLVWDGVIIREVPEIGNFIDGNNTLSTSTDWSSLATAGDSSGRVSPIFLCGQQAIAYGMGQKPRIIVDSDYDYEFQPGVACELKLDIDKAFFNNVQHGMVTNYVWSALD